MLKRTLRERARRLLRQTLERVAIELDERDLRRPAIVFSPHFDDETLGCGGTILKKNRAGADVKIVFMTDGSGSHRDLVPRDALRETRRAEGLAAAGQLGVDAADVFTLAVEDGCLREHKAAAVRQVREILLRHEPQDVFVPYRHEPPADHVATHRIVTSALREHGEAVRVYEYPIWFWRHWPWVSVSNLERRALWRVTKSSIASCSRSFVDFRWRVPIADVIDRKRAALERHGSQMARPDSDPRWPTLSDVWDGDFLECFFQAFEVFARGDVTSGITADD